jgi:hypothetical protein
MKMHSRDVARRSLLSSVLSSVLLLPSLALAQEATQPPADAPAETEEGAAAPAPAPEKEAGAAPKAEEKPTQAEAEAQGPKEGVALQIAAQDAGAGKPPPLALERLPSTAYPSRPIPGIKGGSLALSINHLQWPYMPKYAGEPDFRIGFSGSSWADASMRDVKAGLDAEADQFEYRMQGRFTFRVTPVYNPGNDWFVQSNAEFVAITEQNNSTTNYADIDDAYIRIGKWKTFDITVGRVQGFEVYHFGMGLDLNTFERLGAASFSKTPAPPYALDALWDRGVNNGAIAAHWYMPEWLRLEFLTRIGVSGQGKELGIRPVGVLDFGFAKLKAGYERRLSNSLFDQNQARVEMQGLGASLQFVLDPWVELGGNIARRTEDAFDQDGAPRLAASFTTTTWGGFVNVRPYIDNVLVGLGYNHTYFENFNVDSFGDPEHTTHHQMFAAAQYLLWDSLYLKYVFAYSSADIKERTDVVGDDGFTNKSMSHRLRVMLLY